MGVLEASKFSMKPDLGMEADIQCKDHQRMYLSDWIV